LQGSTGEYIKQAEQLTQILVPGTAKKMSQVHVFLMGQGDSNLGEDAENQ